MQHRLILCLVLVVFGESLVLAQQINQLQQDYQIRIAKTSETITIDGVPSETVWSTADVATDFWYSFPTDDKRAEEEIRTEVRMTYDDQFIYLTAKCYQPNPYIIQTLKRDARTFWRGEAFALILDPVNEKTNGFAFGVNPENVQTESLVSGDTGRRGSQGTNGINSAWDNKWFSAAKGGEGFWTLEMAIPFKTLRFNDVKTRWGINFVRGEPHSNSYHTWSPVPVQFRGLDLGYTGALIWDAAPKKVKSNFSVIPYVLGSGVHDIEAGEDVTLKGRTGVDAKIAITSSLNLDLTVNPDFSQVDVDEQVTNLTAFNIRFPERRLFFLENSDVFADFGIPPMRPFFSRRIGLDDDGAPIPIRFGARLSGNVNKNLRIGVMNMQTASDSENEVLIDPGQNYTSAAFHQRVFKRSTVKGYFHNRTATGNGELLGDFNRNAGLEFNYRSLDGKVEGFGGYGQSFSDGVPGNDNYFYNVGGGYDSRTFSVYSNLAGVGDNYYADMGFIPLINHYDAARDTSIHVGFQHWFSRASYTLFPKNQPKVISHVFAMRDVFDATSANWELINNRFNLSYSLRMQNSSSFTIDYSNDVINLLFPFGFVSDSEPLPAGRYGFNYAGVEYRSDTRKLFSYQASVEYGGFYNGRRVGYSLLLNYRVQPWGNFSINFVQNNLKFPEPYGETQLFLIGPKIEINFNTNLFWTTFLQYNTQRDNFNINSRLQWRFQPMSDIFLVYSDNYAVEFWGPKNRALVLKVNYWLNL
ncbi:MAG: DUF5916 domain-containing protein [Bacteroidota bacterium]